MCKFSINLVFFQAAPPLVAAEAPSLIKECPGQSFQAKLLLQYLQLSLSDADDVLLEPYLQSWDQLLKYTQVA